MTYQIILLLFVLVLSTIALPFKAKVDKRHFNRIILSEKDYQLTQSFFGWTLTIGIAISILFSGIMIGFPYIWQLFCVGVFLSIVSVIAMFVTERS